MARKIYQNQLDHIKVRPAYYRGNFDYAEEGPYNRLNNPEDDIISEDVMVATPEDLEKIKEQDLEKKRNENMKTSDEYIYPDTSEPAPYNDLFDKNESYPTRQEIINKRASKVSLAVIRGDEIRPCPFGLPVNEACKNAGNSISRMAPLSAVESEEEKERIKKANRLVYAYNKEKKRCPYADKILNNHDKVDCDYADTGQGQPSASFRGSPLYPSTFHGIGYDGMYGYPLGFYADNNQSRNLFFGLFSLLGYHSVEEIVKLANKFDESEEKEKAKILDNLFKKLSDMKEASPEEVEKIEKYLKDFRESNKNNRVDPGIMWRLIETWFGPRQKIM